jgi:N-acetylglucosaminyldiphosphoundecaprenol N-acetyl-beta-D-mannosaminyltransferase
MTDLPQADILGVRVNAQRFDDAVRTLAGWARATDERRYVCTCPVYTLMQCREDPAVHNAVGGADMVTADGMPVVWVQRRWGYPDAERVYGPDVMLALCAVPGLRHFFWGGLPHVVEQLATRLKARFPRIEIAGTCSPPVRDLERAPDTGTVALLNDARPSVIWVGLGSPKQDLWMAMYRSMLTAPLLIGVGAAFDLIAGVRAQAPRWMQRSGLEWVFRFAQEPGRLWRRYVIYNPRFVWGVLRQEWKRRAPNGTIKGQ